MWCNTHNRKLINNKCVGGGILLPCRVVDITYLVEIEDQMTVIVNIDFNHGDQCYSQQVVVSDTALADVRFNFNPSDLHEVVNLKAIAAAFITLCEQGQLSKPFAGREFAMGKTEVQAGSMWAVAGAIKQVLQTVVESKGVQEKA